MVREPHGTLEGVLFRKADLTEIHFQKLVSRKNLGLLNLAVLYMAFFFFDTKEKSNRNDTHKWPKDIKLKSD